MLKQKEVTSLLITVISTKMFLTFPKMMIINSGNSAWLQAIYNILTVLLIFFVTYALYRGKKNIIELAQISGGKGLKIIIGLLVFVTLIINSSSIIRIFPETIKIVLLQEFRVEFIIAAFLVAIGIGAYMGIEAIGKINYMFLPIAGVVLLIFFVLLIPYYRIENIMPILGEGIKPILLDGINSNSLFSDLILLNVLLPHCENLLGARKSGYRAILTGGVTAVLILLAYCLIFPYPISKDFMIPVYQLSSTIQLSSFFSRFEAMFQFIWSILMLLYAAIYIYALCYVWQTTFSLKFHEPLIFPIVIIVGIIGMIPGSVLDLIKTETLENIIVYPIAFLLPMIFGVVSRKYYGEKTGNDSA